MARIPRASRGAAPVLLLLLAALVSVMLLPLAHAAPEVTITRFKQYPKKLFYFDDSEVVLMHESDSSLQRSTNEGKTWSQVEQVTEVFKVIEHPFSKEIAFVIGKHKKHWVTHNRGESWLSFETGREATRSSSPLSFHATQPDWILFQGTACEKGGGIKWPWGSSQTCWDETFYTKDAFRTEARKMLALTSECKFARTKKEVEAPESLIFCVAFSAKAEDGQQKYEDARLFQSQDWFESKEYVDLGIGKQARGVVGMGIVSKFMVVAVKSPGEGKDGNANPMQLYVSTDGKAWNQAQFPHSVLPDLVENAYTIVESTTHSLAIDVLSSNKGIGNLFVSSSHGTQFVQSLMDTNRNERGIVDYEQIYGLEGVGIANAVVNREEVIGGAVKELFSWISYDDGSSWTNIKPPAKKLDGSNWDCNLDDPASCSLHLHSVSDRKNLGDVFSSTAPGYVMGVGSVGSHLLPYDQCETFLSTDAGLNWRMVHDGAHLYEFGDQGSVLVMVDDEQATDHVDYTFDGGQTWKELDLGIKVRALVLTTIPDSTSQKFLLLGQAMRGDATGGRFVTIFLDFAGTQPRQCGNGDTEIWYARSTSESECLMGHKQWYARRKLDAKCYMGNKFEDPVGHEENCKCTKADYECDFNYVLQDGKCVAAGPETVPPGACKNPGEKYMGSSGYRKIPGNTCEGGVKLDDKVQKDCTGTRKPEDNGKVSSVVHSFEAKVLRHNYFANSLTILLHMSDGSAWQSSNEGYSWTQLEKDTKFLSIIMHPFDDQRAYLLTEGKNIWYTTDRGGSWNTFTVPEDPNNLGIPVFDFHPEKSDRLIFTGSVDCQSEVSSSCRAKAFYTEDHGRRWKEIESYIKSCQWARDTQLKVDDRMIICESYKDKKGSQRRPENNQMQLIAGGNYYRNKDVLFDSVVGWTTFSEFLFVAELKDRMSLTLQVSLDSKQWAEAQFPPGLRVENHAYTILESNTHAVFLHMTMNAKQGSEWGSIYKSNSNGTYYSLSVEHVNRNSKGYVDFEKMIGLDGIAMVNIVANPDHADIAGKKKLQSRITHNDGGRWTPLTPPAKDSLGQAYKCDTTACGLHVHGYTARRDPKATYSSPSAVGFMLAVGNVGEELAAYEDSDIFLTRDGGSTWQEVHKDAHMWEYGDSGSILVLVNDEGPTDHILFSIDQGLSWNTYTFGERLRVQTIQTVPQDTSRRFFLIGQRPSDKDRSVLIHLDFSHVFTRRCDYDAQNPNNDDYELWSPAENRKEECLFGRRMFYHRRIRDRECYVGEKIEQLHSIERGCTCTAADFECEFNYYRDSSGKCVLVDGASPLDKSTEAETCIGFNSTWYERTAYRKIPYSSCIDGETLDRGLPHACPGLVGARLGGLFWASIVLLPFACAALGGYWWYAKAGGRPGAIRLGEHRAYGGDRSSGLSTAVNVLASVPYFLLGLISAGWSALERHVPALDRFSLQRRRAPYRAVPIDDDAELLGEYEDD
ncbi:hypothetical protein CcaverHIS002_0210320 [Cutaneotrichosporon cavernicola]|nr:hypothetical protein CcaverHIS002_0210320 [Cutaneotrichosporon cavernicola]BEI97443.1 hypothetical protein CcaverHIS631_0210320 [Cutaneotrichosporon cavernicola]BEJ05221.1 hypothetical protein CcaverHIS641_0210380 [Cutaneotrichosporon cavernicola]